MIGCTKVRSSIDFENNWISICLATEFQEELLKHLSIDNIDQLFTHLDELKHPQPDPTTTALISEQQLKLAECEDTLEKFRSQRERMLTKMKDIKTNNETLTAQVNLSLPIDSNRFIL